MLTKARLHDRILGALLGAAIGDALGGPVEGKTFSEIEQTTGPIHDLLPYTAAPWAFYAWKQAPGTVTDDTRLRHIFIEAILREGTTLSRDQLKQVILEKWQKATGPMEKDWLEEYAASAQRDRLYVGGYPGNGGLISSLPAGLVHPGDPHAAYRSAFAAIFIDQGYARDCSATYCAIAAAALTSEAPLEAIIENGIANVPQDLVASRFFGRPLERHFTKVQKIIQDCPTFDQYKAPFYRELTFPEPYDALETFGFAMGTLLATPDQPEQALCNAVNLGRDNDSTATVVGGLLGCRYGLSAWRRKWIDTVVQANPQIDFYDHAAQLTAIAWCNMYGS